MLFFLTFLSFIDIMRLEVLQMNNRIRELRKTLGLRQREFAERIGLKQNAISYMEKNGSTVTEQNIKSICSQFNVNEHWLRTGLGQMFLENEKKQRRFPERMLVNFLCSNPAAAGIGYPAGLWRS